jgi:hypothetical protein
MNMNMNMQKHTVAAARPTTCTLQQSVPLADTQQMPRWRLLTDTTVCVPDCLTGRSYGHGHGVISLCPLTTPLSEKSTNSNPSSGHSSPLYCFTAPPCTGHSTAQQAGGHTPT